MQISDRHTYEASADAVLAMFADEKAVRQRYESMGHRDIEILECERTPESLRIRSSRVVDVELPSFAKKVLKPTNTMVQTDEWKGDGAVWTGTFAVEVRGAPVKIHGTMRLDPQGDRALHAVTIDMEVKVPLVGARSPTGSARTTRCEPSKASSPRATNGCATTPDNGQMNCHNRRWVRRAREVDGQP
ncbi:MAG TPA: DUF2505 domain-containing protein [Acidimicrobiia bacterium]|jgi:hypothetical protein